MGMSEDLSISVDTKTGVTKVVSKAWPACNGTYKTERLASIHIGLAQLRQFQKDGTSSHPVELAWEIKLYEFILAQPNPEEVASEYLMARHPNYKGGFVPKRDVVKALGWPI